MSGTQSSSVSFIKESQWYKDKYTKFRALSQNPKWYGVKIMARSK